MATDNTPPRLRLIGTIAFIVVITLLGLNFVFESYFAYMTDEARREKLAPTSEKTAQIAAEQASWQGAKMQIGQAALQLQSGARPEMIEPKPSDDIGAMTGWSKLPKQAPLPAPAGAPGMPLDRHGMDMNAAGDGGAAMAADGGAAAGDGGPGAPAAPKGGAASDAGAPKGGATTKDGGARAPH